MKYELYVLDTETTGLTQDHDIIELSIYRLNTDEQRTWWIRPLRTDNISSDALRVNQYKIEDLLGQTKEGRERHQPASKVIVEIENWVMEDANPADTRLIVAQNASFDKMMLEGLWDKTNNSNTFPFSRKYALDTMNIELVMDLIREEESEGYSLAKLCKKYGVKNVKAHSAAEDTSALVKVFRAQIASFQALRKTG